MADVSDVQNAIVDQIDAVLYPNGAPQDGSLAPSPVCGAPCRIFAGWPNAQLDDDVANGIVVVSVFPPDGMERNTTRYPRTKRKVASSTVTLAWAVTDNAATLSGAVLPSQNLVLIVKTTTDEQVYGYSVQAGDTLAGICATFASLIPGATSNGATVTVPDAQWVAGRAGGFSTLISEVRRQERPFQISFWCSTPDVRDLVAPPVDAALAEMIFIALPDGSSGRIRYVRTSVIDDAQNANLYRRDLIYTVEYPTTIRTTAAQVLAWKMAMQGGVVPPTSPTDPTPTDIVV